MSQGVPKYVIYVYESARAVRVIPPQSSPVPSVIKHRPLYPDLQGQ